MLSLCACSACTLCAGILFDVALSRELAQTIHQDSPWSEQATASDSHLACRAEVAHTSQNEGFDIASVPVKS